MPFSLHHVQKFLTTILPLGYMFSHLLFVPEFRASLLLHRLLEWSHTHFSIPSYSIPVSTLLPGSFHVVPLPKLVSALRSSQTSGRDYHVLPYNAKHYDKILSRRRTFPCFEPFRYFVLTPLVALALLSDLRSPNIS